MARPQKQGIDYFSFDVDFFTHRKVRRIMRDCGPKSVSVLICLLCNIYRKEGYYIVWDREMGFDISDQLMGLSEALVEETVNKAIAVEFFDKERYEKFKILTSRGIQERFLEATKRRGKIDIEEKYRVIDDKNGVFVYNNSVSAYNNSVFVYRNTQSKGKEIKVKERENPPYPPFSEKSESFGSLESPKKEELPLNTEKEEKEKSCGQKEKEEREVLEGGKSDLRPSDAPNDSLRSHYTTQERKSILEAPSGLKTASRSEGQPTRAMQETKTGFSGAPHQQKLFGEVRYPFDSEKFTKAWGLWKRYKREEHSFKYKSALSEQVALNALHKLSQGKEARALSIIEQSMANGWEGLFELKNPSREQGGYPSALEKLRSDQVLFEGFAMKYVSQLTKTDFEHFCGQWDLSQESQGGWEEKGKRQLLAGLEKYLNTVIYRKKREEKTTDHNAIDIKKSTIRKLG